MNKDLENLIKQFYEAQLEAVGILESHFQSPRPVTIDDYIGRCVEKIQKLNYEANGYKIRPHGYGMEINTGSFKIDSDFGENGEINGFDPWRLEEFVRVNNIKTKLKSAEKIKRAVADAVENSEIYKSSYINYYVCS